ncbi:GvpL/GvpF family gas vesicle protein [Sinosporangium siamense]|uniref:Gas vesicle protein n=1 Tax=Sinosporangium siamense TaxID=1367973 RepID=A0A919RJ74_9ACTN|nr:GvpL/GvpF family gas vesicle protein [Sinosporangium siamense]GII92874.1 gas vesicle protein [Sinosporangium siamense]
MARSASGTSGKEKADTTAVPQQRGRGTYIYGLVQEDVEVSPDARGVGDPPARVNLISHGEIAALVSDVRLDRPLGTPDSLLAHEQLLDDTAAEVPVIPVRFGAVMSTREQVVEELLKPHHDAFRDALAALEGRAEFIVKGRYIEEAVLQEILEENPDAARLQDEIRDRPEELTRDVRIQLGELVGREVEERREEDTADLSDELEPICADMAVREPTHEWDAVYLALLVDNDREDEVARVVDDFARRSEGRIRMRLRGPLAPYDFVVAPRPGEQSDQYEQGEGEWD